MVCMDACTVNLHLLSQHLLPRPHEGVNAACLSERSTLPLVLQAAVLEDVLKLLIAEADARGRHHVSAQRAASSGCATARALAPTGSSSLQGRRSHAEQENQGGA